MVDNINKRGPVSPNLECKIDNIKGAEGNKRKIDTRNELNQLSNLLSGNSEWSSIERGYLEEEIKIATEYIEQKEAKDKQKAIDNELTPGTKKDVDRIAKRMKDKKKIDTDEEADALLLMLRNTKGVYNKADLQYIKDALINNGYGNLLPEENKEPANEIKSKTSEESIASDKKGKETIVEDIKVSEEKVSEEEVSEEEVKMPPNPFLPVKDGETKSSAPKNSAPPVKSENKAPKETDARGKDSKPEVKKYEINDGDQTKGEGLADKLFAATRTPGYNSTERSQIRSALNYVNDENAYSFFTKFKTLTGGRMINEIVFNRADSDDDLGANHVSKAHYSLLGQAKKMGLSGTKEYKTLANCMGDHDALIRHSEGENFVDPQPKLIVRTDNAVKALLKLMDNYVKQNP